MIRAVAAISVLVTAGLVACSTFSSDDNTVAPSDRDAASDAEPDADSNGEEAAAPAEASTDAGPADAWPAGAVFYESFDLSSGCAGFENDTATLMRTTDEHYTGAASCEVCITTSQGFATHTVKLPAAVTKSVRLEMRAKSVSGDASSVMSAMHITLFDDATYVNDTVKYGPVEDGRWDFGQNIFTQPVVFNTVIIGVGASAPPGTCVYIDDVTLFVE